MKSHLAWKKLVLAGLVSSTVFVSSVQPAFAAENFFQKIQHSVSSSIDGFYLKYVPGNKPGKLVVRQMTDSYKNLKSFQSDVSIDLDVIGNGQSMGAVSLKAGGPTVVGDITNPQTYKQDLKVEGQLSMQGTTMKAMADLRMIDGITYLRVTQLPAIPGASLDQVKDKWIKFDPATTTGSKETTKWTPEQQQKMQEAFMKMVESAQVSEAKPEKKDNTDVYVITLSVTKQSVADYVMTLSDIQRQVVAESAKTAAQDSLMMPQKDPAQIKKELEDVLGAVSDFKLTLWVERGHYYPKHFELPLEVDVKKIEASQAGTGSSAVMPAAKQVDKVNVKIVGNTDKFNESFTVSIPDGAEDSQTFFQKMMGPAMMGGTGAGAGAITPPTMMGTKTGKLPAYPTSVGTSELPKMTDQQKKQLDQYLKDSANKIENLDY